MRSAWLCLVYPSLSSFGIKGQEVPHSEDETYSDKSQELDREGPHHVIKCPLPDKNIVPPAPIEQLGLWSPSLSDFDKWKGRAVDCVTDKLSVKKIPEVISEATGKMFDTMQVTRELFEMDEARASNPQIHLNSCVFAEDLIKDTPIKESRRLVEGFWDLGDWCLQAGGVEKNGV
ncbi:hypothetical protein CcaverHIS002_0502270 [Cutaneotrichosporon cavernicola]|nr:hypothetical protein CcaverHIS002_0502270 [Cutaneotrichosporon cavernicola]